MNKLLCWLGLHDWVYVRTRSERAIIDLLGFRPMLHYRVYRCSCCPKEKEIREL